MQQDKVVKTEYMKGTLFIHVEQSLAVIRRKKETFFFVWTIQTIRNKKAVENIEAVNKACLDLDLKHSGNVWKEDQKS